MNDIADIELYNRVEKYIIYKNKFMIVFKSTKNEFIVWNTLKIFSDGKNKGHSHLNSLKQASQICDDIANNKFPKSRNMYVLSAYIRCSHNKDYILKVKQIIQTRKNKGNTLEYSNKPLNLRTNIRK